MNQPGSRQKILIVGALVVVAVGAGIWYFSNRTQVVVSVIDATSRQPINGALVSLRGLGGTAIPEGQTPATDFGKQRTRNGLATFSTPTAALDHASKYAITATADDYVSYSTVVDKSSSVTISLISKQGNAVSSESAAIDYAKKNQWVAYWLAAHPSFDPSNPANYRVQLLSPTWWVTFKDETLKNQNFDCEKNNPTWDAIDIRCIIKAEVRASDGAVITLVPDLANTDWAPAMGFPVRSTLNNY